MHLDPLRRELVKVTEPEAMATLRALRLARGWTQTELANRAGVAVNTIVRLEKGRAFPSLVTLRAVAEALGARIDICCD